MFHVPEIRTENSRQSPTYRGTLLNHEKRRSYLAIMKLAENETKKAVGDWIE